VLNKAVDQMDSRAAYLAHKTEGLNSTIAAVDAMLDEAETAAIVSSQFRI
jgi:hypothetical protein